MTRLITGIGLVVILMGSGYSISNFLGLDTLGAVFCGWLGCLIYSFVIDMLDLSREDFAEFFTHKNPPPTTSAPVDL